MSKAEIELLRTRVVSLVEIAPEKAALLLNFWIHQKDKKVTAITGKAGPSKKTTVTKKAA